LFPTRGSWILQAVHSEVTLRLRIALLLGSSIGLALVAAGTKVGKFVVEAL
jgi:hypothetical protein